MALTVLYDVLKSDLSNKDKLELISGFDYVLGLDLVKKAEEAEQNTESENQDTDTAEIEALIEKRTQARKNKDWATADAIRDELNARNVVIKDTPNGIEWSFRK